MSRDPRMSLAYLPFFEVFLAKILETCDLTKCEGCGGALFNRKGVRPSRRKTKCGNCKKIDKLKEVE